MLLHIMANSNHKELASCIKNVHQTLRLEARQIGEERAWEEHCQRTEILQNYAQAMRQLATEYWDKNADDDQNKKAVSRVKWTVKQCEDYFFSGGINEAFSKEIAQCLRLNLETSEISHHKPDFNCDIRNLRVLDVGSCYNPFQNVKRFDVVAVDIAPACDDVYQCDFLNLKVLEKESEPLKCDGKINELPEAFFDVVVFSLLLEYLPSCKQRYMCCNKASKLLVPGGILCIITPDSKHASANSGIMKKWKYALANVGLLRIVYDKLPHLHCMVFRKCIHSKLSREWLSSSKAKDLKKGKSFSDPPEQLMVIPQDFQIPLKCDENTEFDVRDDDETIANIFADLPAF